MPVSARREPQHTPDVAGGGAAVPATTDALWRRFRAGGDPDARAELLERYIGLVHHHAREVTQRARELELDELVSAGTIGLVQALHGFDPGRGLAFSTYAMPRIRGAMLDELRRHDRLPRSVRVRSRRLEEARATLQQRLGRAPEPREIAAELGVDLDTYWRWVDEAHARVPLALEAPGGADAGEGTLAETVADPAAPEPGARLVEQERWTRLRESLAALPERERMVLALYFYEELNLRQIGEVLHITESRVSQIRTRALRRLRDELEPREEAA
jgi:RNA polymerase sigma factor for flagellar operon FliA